MRNRILAIAAIVVLGLAYVGWRFFLHSTHLTPAIITPQMNAHEAISPDFHARLSRLLNEQNGDDRSHRPKLIALTFDDGPYPIFTPLLLEQLHRLGVPATFFLIGRDAEQWPELTQRVESNGNEIANHTYSHPNLDQESDAQVREEILLGRDTLWKLVRDPAIRVLMRPPHGRYTEATVRVVQKLGYQFVLWTDDSGDWRTLTPQEIENHLRAHATAPEIVLLHSGKLATVEALPGVVARFRAAGYRFVTVGELLGRVPADQINHPAKHAV